LGERGSERRVRNGGFEEGNVKSWREIRVDLAKLKAVLQSNFTRRGLWRAAFKTWAVEVVAEESSALSYLILGFEIVDAGLEGLEFFFLFAGRALEGLFTAFLFGAEAGGCLRRWCQFEVLRIGD